ncbi:MAG: aminotransferase class V-fold PLP-dependent enzyme [Clostridia bacterium]|nr:aminotransferase class V-fold PLP-dependent enzyme [Clostridia bacterium]
MSLLEKLEKLRESDTLPMHMPGHKRRDDGGALPYSLDITEIAGFDDLHHRTGILRELSDKAAKLRGASSAFSLVNGSTCGILASVYALTKRGDTVIIARNCHKSVYHACEIRNLNVKYIYPPVSDDGVFLSVPPESIVTALEEYPAAKLVIITSPTYEGVISDIKSISDSVHSHGAKLLVDAAHGAHLGYSECFPQSAVSLGADISIESLHKTLPSLTQTAMLYANSGIDAEKIEYALDIFETSSPSYILLASIDKCLDIIEKDGARLFEEYSENLNAFYKSTAGLKHLEILDFTNEDGAFDSDKGKLVISCKNTDITGFALAEKLRENYHIEPEMSAPAYIICMTSVYDDAGNFNRLTDALKDIDSSLDSAGISASPSYPKAQVEISISEALNGESENIPLMQAEGRISAEYLWAYPPGIPVIAPGEIITSEIVNYIKFCRKSGCNLIIPGRETADEISVK